MTTEADHPVAPQVIRMAEGDEVVIALQDLPAGIAVPLDSQVVTLPHDVRMGFKVAVADLPAGTVVHRLGFVIGVLTAPVRAGEVVHTHNLASRYLRTHARGEA